MQDVKSQDASTVFDAGSTFGDSGSQQQAEIPDETEDLTASVSQIGLAGMGMDQSRRSELAGSTMRSSMTAKTEGLADPFADDDVDQSSSSQSVAEQQSIPTGRSSKSLTRASRPRSESSRRPRSAAKPKRSVGREVLELEFGEAVRSVVVRPSTVRLSSGESFKLALLVVVLKTKAVLFELGEHIPAKLTGDSSQAERPASSSAAWGIVYRFTTDLLDDGKGLVDLVCLPGKRTALLTLAGRQPGHVQVILLSLLSPKKTSSSHSSSGILASSIIVAHEGPLASLVLSPDGRLLASASTRGTLIRVWSITPSVATSTNKARTSVKAVLLSELRRGTEQASILSMAFAPDRSALAAASDKGTIHFFNLTSLMGSDSGSSTPSRSSSSSPAPTHERSSSSSSSGGIRLSNAASKYLPSGVNKLASQIPSSMLPQYLRSQWSTAQYRIKLRSFAAHLSEDRVRKSSSTAQNRGGKGKETDTASSSTLDPDVPVGGAGVAKSLEGAWATMKGRLEDIRRWEPALDEQVFLTWVRAPSAAGSTASPAYHLISLTTLGAWYRISFDRDAGISSTDVETSGSTVLDMYRTDSRSSGKERQSLSTGNKDGTTLVEYGTFGAKDEWSARM